MNSCRLIVFSFFLVRCAYGDLEAPEITINVLVRDEDSGFVEGANLKAAFGGWGGITGELVEAFSDSNGVAHLTGQSLFAVRLTAEKSGYYPSRLEVQTSMWNQNLMKNVYSDQSVVLELRQIKNPVPMYARSEFEVRIPAINTQLGFDLLEGDWVQPHGGGAVTDILISVTGYFNTIDDYDSLLRLSFPNKGDGLLNFGSPHQHSSFRSPYEAPAEGYLSHQEWRKSRMQIPSPRGNNPEQTKAGVRDDFDGSANYAFRIRASYDASGTVTGGYYGKIYGDINFFGAHQKGTGINFKAIYLNPRYGDRNLEYDPNQNLLTNLKPWNQPRTP